jgi:hypothetical protein
MQGGCHIQSSVAALYGRPQWEDLSAHTDREGHDFSRAD